MILADTSAWVEYLRRTGSPAHARVRELIAADDLATTEPVIMEVLAGPTRPDERGPLRRLLYRFERFPVESPDWEAAAEIYGACRRAGRTPRSHLYCLIAAVAIREDVPLLHRDSDFDLIARHAPLRVDRASAA